MHRPQFDAGAAEAVNAIASMTADDFRRVLFEAPFRARRAGRAAELATFTMIAALNGERVLICCRLSPLRVTV